MASEIRPPNPPVAKTVEDRLFDEPYAFEFVQAVRLLGSYARRGNNVGLFDDPREEMVRFGVPASLVFPASEILALERREGAPPQMRVNFFGLTGPLGVLPIYYTEFVAERLQNRDRTLSDFLDIFNHRLISLFYRAWAKYRFLVRFEEGEDDAFTHALLDVIGLGTEGLGQRQVIPDLSILNYAGLLAQHPRSAVALEQIVADYFGVPATVEQFLGAWYALSEEAQCNLNDEDSDSRQMGFGAIVGDEVWDPQARVRIVLGPLSLDEYLQFLPSGSAFEPLRTLVRFFAGDELDFEVQLILRSQDVPRCELGALGSAAPRLGWTSWGATHAMTRDPGETILQL